MTQQGAPEGSMPKGGIVIPAQGTATDGFLDSVLQILSDNIGAYVICEFLVGTNTIVGRQGILEFVGPSYIVLHDDTCQSHIIGDASALRFVSICFGEEGENGVASPEAATQQAPQDSATPAPAPRTLSGPQMVSTNQRIHSQAAFNYAKRKTRP